MTVASVRERSLLRTLAVAALALSLPACVTEGDFGRRQNSLVLDRLAPATGAFVARHASGEAVSEFALTDDERTLRDRAWRFLMPASSRDVFGVVLAEARFTRLLPARFMPVRAESYYVGLMRGDARSSRTPWRRLVDDMAADRALLEPFFANAEAVLATDRVRGKGLAYVSELQPAERENAVARMAENQHLVWWVDDALELRIDAYQYALERLFIQLPDDAAVEAERTLAALTTMAGLPPRPAGKARPGVVSGDESLFSSRFFPGGQDRRPQPARR